MSINISPLILSSANPGHQALCLTQSSSGVVLLIYASGLVLNILDAASLCVHQTLNLAEHLAQFYPHAHSIDAVFLTEDNSNLAVACGPHTVIFAQSNSSPSSWTLHSSFTSYISRIISVILKQSHCLVAGHDGLSLHELWGPSSVSDSEDPPRWIRKWALRGHSCDQADFLVHDDGVCHLAAITLGSPVLRTYEYYPLAVRSPNQRDFSQATTVLSLPARSIYYTHDHISGPKPSQPLSTLLVEVLNPISGIHIHAYHLIKNPTSLPSHETPQYMKPAKSTARYVHTGICALRNSINSPRILAAFPLHMLNSNLRSKIDQLVGSKVWVNALVLSNGEVLLARFSKTATTLPMTRTPSRLSNAMLDFLRTPDVMIYGTTTMKDSSENSLQMTCSILARSSTSTGKMFLAEVPLGDVLVDQTIPARDLRPISTQILPFGFTPLNHSLCLYPDQSTGYTDVLLSANTHASDTRHLYLCNDLKDQIVKDDVVPMSRLLAYDLNLDTSTNGVQGTGAVHVNTGYCPINCNNSSVDCSGARGNTSGRIGPAVVYAGYQDGKLRSTVRSVSFREIALQGFKDDELPKTLMIKRSARSNSDEANSEIMALCLTTFHRLLFWSLSEAPNSLEIRTQSALASCEVPLAAEVLTSTLQLALPSSPSALPEVLALDIRGQLIRGRLNCQPNEILSDTSPSNWVFQDILQLCPIIDPKDLANQAVLLVPHDSRYVAILCLLSKTGARRTFRLVILDLKQQPYSPGVMGVDDIEVEQTDYFPKLVWSPSPAAQKSPNDGPTSSFLAVLCGGDVVNILGRDNDGWWRRLMDVDSNGMGPICQVSWILSPDDLVLTCRIRGHAFVSSSIQCRSRTSLPYWHPVLLRNMLSCGNIQLVISVLSCLSLCLEGAWQPLALLCSMLDASTYRIDYVDFEALDKCAEGLATLQALSPTSLSSAHIDIVAKAAVEIRIPLISERDQPALKELAQHLLQLQTAKAHGIDPYGCQYILSLVRYLDHHSRSQTDLGFGTSQDPGLLFAHHSPCQSLLAQETTSILKNYSSDATAAERKLDWNMARTVGLFLWLKPEEEVRSYMELVAKAEYVGGLKDFKTTALNSSEQDPCACSLFYMALGKKRLLLGLWKVAYGHSDRPHMMKFLQNDFSEPRWKTAALKNAYALISRQRFSFAASFFLLADRLQDAVNICVRQLADWQLAVAITRAYEVNQGPVLQKLLREVVIPLALSNGNRWLMSWAFSMLGQSNLARRALVVSLDEVAAAVNPSPLPTKCLALPWGPVDISLAVLFNDTKSRYKPELSWAEEKSLVLLLVEELLNSGGQLIALQLATTWKFPHPTQQNLNNDSEVPSVMKTQTNVSQMNEICSSSCNTNSTLLAPEPKSKGRVLVSQPVVPEFELSNFF